MWTRSRASDRTSSSLCRTTSTSWPGSPNRRKSRYRPGISQPGMSPCLRMPSSSDSTDARRASDMRCRNTRRTRGSRSRWPSCSGGAPPAIRYRATSSGQSKPRPLYVTSQPKRGIRAASSASRAGSSAWSGRRSWTCRNRLPSHQPSPTRNASVPAAVASPVVSVSRQRRGASAGGWPGRLARRSRSTGRIVGGDSTMTIDPNGVRTSSPPTATARRSAPIDDARRASTRGRGRSASPLRKFAKRRSSPMAVTRLGPFRFAGRPRTGLWRDRPA
jgi:hypothetical protein